MQAEAIDILATMHWWMQGEMLKILEHSVLFWFSLNKAFLAQIC